MKTVTIHHPDTGQQADVFEPAVIHHESRGWVVGPKPAASTDRPRQTSPKTDTKTVPANEKVS